MYFIKATTLLFQGPISPDVQEVNPDKLLFGNNADDKGYRNGYKPNRLMLLNLCNKDLYEVEGGMFTKVVWPDDGSVIINLPFDEVVAGVLDRQR